MCFRVGFMGLGLGLDEEIGGTMMPIVNSEKNRRVRA